MITDFKTPHITGETILDRILEHFKINDIHFDTSEDAQPQMHILTKNEYCDLLKPHID